MTHMAREKARIYATILFLHIEMRCRETLHQCKDPSLGSGAAIIHFVGPVLDMCGTKKRCRILDSPLQRDFTVT